MADSAGQGTGAGPSEDSLIAQYFRPLAAALPGTFELRDDAAALTLPEGMDLVVTTDALIADVHFFADDNPADIAFKALAVNVSDLAAKAADPLAYSLALVLPGGVDDTWVGEFTYGLWEAQSRFGITLSGGDTTVSRGGPLTIAITAFGTVPHGRMIRRGGARAGDSLYVTGTIGNAALGLKLRRGDADTAAWHLAPLSHLMLSNCYQRPEPCLALRDALRAHASAAMDISDGLAIDAARLCTASAVDGVIEVTKVPMIPLAASEPALTEIAITGGDDYEILVAIRRGEEAEFERAAAKAGENVTRIGELMTGSGRLTLVGDGGVPLRYARSGYDHFQI
jgi:thiamine-monophosphate kinase